MIGKTRKDKKEKGKEKGGKSSSREHKPVPSPRDDVHAMAHPLLPYFYLFIYLFLSPLSKKFSFLWPIFFIYVSIFFSRTRQKKK